MVHGKEDHFVPCFMTEEGFRCCNGNKQLLLADGAGHGLSFIYATAEYTQMIEKFLVSELGTITQGADRLCRGNRRRE